ncbi:hypothetical protein I4U23_024740 [Adineta vaga]|nr:hypothetical protein I4U23_024740 [Adineta vaga]
MKSNVVNRNKDDRLEAVADFFTSMNCILLVHFLLLLLSIVLLIFGICTPRWIVSVHNKTSNIISEHSDGILEKCQRFSKQDNIRNKNDDMKICFNYLFKWFNGFQLWTYQKVLIGISFSCIFIAIISLCLTQLIENQSSFYKIYHSKRIVDYLLITNILTGILALITLILFFGFEHIQSIFHCGYSFWLFVLGTCCIFICCLLIAIFRIDVEFEFHHYYHESVATLF